MPSTSSSIGILALLARGRGQYLISTLDPVCVYIAIITWPARTSTVIYALYFFLRPRHEALHPTGLVY